MNIPTEGTSRFIQQSDVPTPIVVAMTPTEGTSRFIQQSDVPTPIVVAMTRRRTREARTKK